MCNCLCTGMHIYRAVVSAASSVTGDIYVKIPAALGPKESVPITKLGREEVSEGVWNVPNVGDTVIVAVENDRFSNVYILQIYT